MRASKSALNLRALLLDQIPIHNKGLHSELFRDIALVAITHKHDIVSAELKYLSRLILLLGLVVLCRSYFARRGRTADNRHVPCIEGRDWVNLIHDLLTHFLLELRVYCGLEINRVRRFTT